MPGYRVDPHELRDGSGQIADAIAGADDLELESISENSAPFGDDAVAGELKNFCTTWELAIGVLQQRSASAGETLDGVARQYEQQEEHAAHSLPQQQGHS